MKIGVIDVGTNTVLLLIARFDAHEQLKTLREEQRIIRIGEGVEATRNISGAAIERLNESLHELKLIARDSDEVDSLAVIATSALRRAENASAVLQSVKNENNIEIEILTGDEEARLTYTGATFGLSVARDSLVCVIDIGGGSTEVVVGNNEEIIYGRSFLIGCVGLTEKFFPRLPALPAERSAGGTYISKVFHPLESLPCWQRKPMLIGVAGTVTSLAMLAKDMPAFDAERIAGTILPLEKIDALTASLQSRSRPQLNAMPGIEPGRADLLPAGSMLLHTFMHKFGFPSILVSERGLRYGAAVREYSKRKPKK